MTDQSKIAPAEPTPEMVNAGRALGFFQDSVKKIYRAMLAHCPDADPPSDLHLSQIDYLADTVASQVKRIAELERDVEGMRADAARLDAALEWVCENHPDQPAHMCPHCNGAGMPRPPAETDTTRLDWLDRDDIDLIFHTREITGAPFVRIVRVRDGSTIGEADTLRAAIDAALAKERE